MCIGFACVMAVGLVVFILLALMVWHEAEDMETLAERLF